ncbi:hypothetical protein FO519_000946 [Halicephalobus sp. NKZ332]|nr:hypothetical protein FO519_000946 [Halicephalobus sp. NKZ332]
MARTKKTMQAVDFDLTDIEDIDGISDEIDAEPSSDDDTFISYKKKKPTKRRYKDEIHSRIEQKEAEGNEIGTSSGSEAQVSEALSVNENDKKEQGIEASLAERIKMSTNVSPQMCPPTDHFNELERKMNGPGWKITSSSASCSEDELGANEKDEFTFKMCQIIKRSHRFNKKNKNQRHRRKASDSDSMLVSTSTVTELAKSASPIKNQQVNAVKGRFMTHMLHSAYFFPHTVDVKWSATARGKPELPVWLHLFPSKHKSIAYLIGTPVTPFSQVNIHVMARRLDTFAMSEQYLTFVLQDDPKYNTSTQQTVELLVTNQDPESFVNDRSGKIQKLENSIRETFRGKFVNPYIFDLLPEVQTEENKMPAYEHYMKNRRFGTIVKIGTQRRFHPNVEKLVEELQENPNYCSRNTMIPLDKHFVPEFMINWCNFKLNNVTMIKSLTKTSREAYEKEQLPAIKKTVMEQSTYKTFIANETNSPITYQYSFWESFLIFPLLAVLCILLILLLSFIFFGRREGQHWRDYKTPREQLQEYLNLRESQKHLRELSVQRQILLMNNDQKASSPVGIRTFLQPNPPDGEVNNPKLVFNESSDGASDNAEHLPKHHRAPSTAKQTVADAVRATGSSIRIYRNPGADSEEDEDEEENPTRKNSDRRSNS